MKTVAALIVAAITASAGYGAGERFASQRQVNTLAQRVTKLEKANRAVLTYIAACFSRWAPITSFTGYVYQGTDGQTSLTTALDLDVSGNAPSFFAPAASADCSIPAARLLEGRVPLGSIAPLAPPAHKTR